ncbi:kinase-like domain-containing protein [Scleroderma citrinum]
MNIDRSINWTAPEILDGKGVASKMDVWSFAMTVLELFTRDLPFSGLSGVRDIMLRIFRGPPDRPSDESTCHRLTERWWDLCSACWNQEPSLRPTMSQIVHRITAISSYHQ